MERPEKPPQRYDDPEKQAAFETGYYTQLYLRGAWLAFKQKIKNLFTGRHE